MFGTLLLTIAVAVTPAQEVPQVEPTPPPTPRHPALDNPNFQRGKVVELPNGLTARIGFSVIGAPLSALPAPETWVEVARATTAMDLDPKGAAAASLRSSAEAFRAALRERRIRDWRPAADRVNALMADNQQHGIVDDDQVRALAASLCRDCALESLRNFDEESAALAQAIVQASGGTVDPLSSERASRLLWRTRVCDFIGDRSGIPMPPAISILLRAEFTDAPIKPGHEQAVEDLLRQHEPQWDAALHDLLMAQARAYTKTEDTPSVLRPVAAIVDRMTDMDARAVESLLAHLDDPDARWQHRILVARCPPARELADAWIALRRLAASAADPLIRTRLASGAEALRSQVDAMRLLYRDAWRALVIHGATPSHPEIRSYEPEMRKIAKQAQRDALALIASMDGAVSEAGPSDSASIARATRGALEPVTGRLEDGKLAAKPLSPQWPSMAWSIPTPGMVSW